MQKIKKFIIKTHGCKTNQLESQVIAEHLTNEGFIQTNDIQDAQAFILNSCSVTSNSDDEALRLLRNVKHKNPAILTVLTGCFAQLKFEELKKLDYVDLLAGNNDKFDLPDLIKTKTCKVTDIFKTKTFNNQIIHGCSKTRGCLKIQDGCNNFCSYCTIPFARGKSRSNSVNNIIEQINLYTQNQIKEVVLTGIHIGQWGQETNQSLQILLEKIEETDIQRYRLGSLNPLELNDELLDFLSCSKKFCPHFHLSLQSLCDNTLQNMNRRYSAQHCLDLIDKLNTLFKLPFLGSDLIAGFPGETENDFETTLKNLEKAKLSNVHVFPYSLRKNTKAAQIKEQIPLKIKKQRASLLKEIADKKFHDFLQKNINTTQSVLIEKHPDKKTGMLKGVSKNYLNVYLDTKDSSLLNTIQNVKIFKFENERLFCTII